MGLTASMLADDALRSTDDGFEVDVHLNWYRSLPLSSVVGVELAVDGETVERDDIAFAVNGHEYELDELRDRFDEYWFVLDAATLRVRRGQPLPADGRTRIDLRLETRIPYLFTAPGRPLVVVGERSKALVASEPS